MPEEDKDEVIKLVDGGKYRFKDQEGTPNLMYIGKKGHWNQFTIWVEGRHSTIWSELLDDYLPMIEEVE